MTGLLALACGGCAGGTAGPLHVRLNPGSADAAVTTPVHIMVSGLPPGLVTVQARARDDEGRLWRSAAQFRVGPAGTLNLATAVPVSGSYHVADADGLLWSLHPAFTRNPSTQFFEGPQGFTVRLQVVVGGQVRAAAALTRSAVLNIRTYSVQTVSREGFASILFTPDKIRPGAPAVVVIGGSEGGEYTPTAASLAQAGYPALALGYFNEPGLPQCLCRIPLEYFGRAVRWLRAQPSARGRPIILYGVSRGGEGALLIASFEPHLFDAVVASSPSSVVNGAFGGNVSDPAWTLHGKALPFGEEIPVGRIRVPLLLGDGGQDEIWDSAASARTIMAELRAAHDPAPYTNLYYPHAGHGFLGTPPYYPYAGYSARGTLLGGTQQANALAIDQSWVKMISFLNDPWRRAR